MVESIVHCTVGKHTLEPPFFRFLIITSTSTSTSTSTAEQFLIFLLLISSSMDYGSIPKQ